MAFSLTVYVILYFGLLKRTRHCNQATNGLGAFKVDYNFDKHV